MKKFLFCTSASPGVGNIRIDVDSITSYFEFDGSNVDFDELEDEDLISDFEFDGEKCVVIKTDSGSSFYVSNSLEEIDHFIDQYNNENRFGYMGGTHD